jgi:hypothetical protein
LVRGEISYRHDALDTWRAISTVFGHNIATPSLEAVQGQLTATARGGSSDQDDEVSTRPESLFIKFTSQFTLQILRLGRVDVDSLEGTNPNSPRLFSV